MKWLRPDQEVKPEHLKSLDEMTGEDWEKVLNEHNSYPWLAYVLYPILWLPCFIAWVLIEYRKY